MSSIDLFRSTGSRRFVATLSVAEWSTLARRATSARIGAYVPAKSCDTGLPRIASYASAIRSGGNLRRRSYRDTRDTARSPRSAAISRCESPARLRSLRRLWGWIRDMISR